MAKKGSIKIGTRTQQFEGAAVRIEGTAPLLVAHPMPWDVGNAFWENFPREVRESPPPVREAYALLPDDKARLKRLGFPVNGKLTPEANAHLRGHWLADLRPAFPASGFMGACRTAVVQYKGKSRDALSAKKLSGAMQILGDETDRSLVALEATYSVENPRIGVNSGPGRAPRIIQRLRFEPGWQATLNVQWLAELLNEQDIAQVIAWSGNWGIGQNRPSSPHAGTNGTYRIVGA